MKLLRRIWPLLLLVLLIAVNSLVWLQRDQIADWWRLRDYEPPKDVAALVSDTTMTPYAERMFLVNHPQLESKESFNANCADHDEETSVLGCYHGDRRGIYIYAVTDERLDGVRQVTAVHEMLHQAYDRLSGSDRDHVGDLLRKHYESGKLSDQIQAKVDSYKDQKGSDLVNEMHSIFGSEVSELPADLENYYKRYFNDRSKVVGYSEAYRGEFTRRKILVAQYDAQLSALKAQIAANKQSLDVKSTYLKSKEKEINKDIAGSDRTEYQADVAAYNAMVDAYNDQLVETRRLIEQHNTIVVKRNAIAVQEQELQKALDSRLEPSARQ
jgi:hypothetical protein